MLAIRDNHVDNHFGDKAVEYICRTFYNFIDQILYFNFSGTYLSANYILKNKSDYYPFLFIFKYNFFIGRYFKYTKDIR